VKSHGIINRKWSGKPGILLPPRLTYSQLFLVPRQTVPF